MRIRRPRPQTMLRIYPSLFKSVLAQMCKEKNLYPATKIGYYSHASSLRHSPILFNTSVHSSAIEIVGKNRELIVVDADLLSKPTQVVHAVSLNWSQPFVQNLMHAHVQFHYRPTHYQSIVSVYARKPQIYVYEFLQVRISGRSEAALGRSEAALGRIRISRAMSINPTIPTSYHEYFAQDEATAKEWLEYIYANEHKNF